MFQHPKILSLNLRPNFHSKIKENQLDNEEEIEESLDSDLEVVEALLAKKYSTSREKYKGKVPLIYFSCE